MAIIATGNAAIVINEEETEAKLVFTPGAEGLGWDVDAVIKLAREQNLSPLPDPSVLEKFIQKAARAKAPMETVIAEGDAPEPAGAERINWETLAIPGDIADFREETLAKARGPELFRIRTEKVKRDTLVKKPGKFPFMPAREEIVTLWDKKEIREEVTVDPAYQDLRYAGRNRRLGSAVPPKPGKPGKNVFGRPIVPPILEDPNFYLGRGIRREKAELRSEYPGFIRIGPNWADIVPLAKPEWEIAAGSDGITLFLQFFPGDPRFPIPKGEDIIGEAKNLGADGEALIGAGEIDRAIADSIKKRRGFSGFSLFTVQEAMARVDVSGDALKAELYLRKGVAGARPLEMKAVSQAVRDSKVQGFNAENLRTAIRAFMEGKTAAMVYTLAEGKAAVRGTDKEVQLIARPLEEERKTLLLNRLKEMKLGDGISRGFPAGFPIGFPVNEAEQLCVVERGMKLAQVTQPPKGEAGHDVYGRPIPGLPGNDPELKLFRGLRLQDSAIIADQSGLLLVKGSGKVFWGAVVDYRDAGVKALISENAMEASAEILRGLGPGLPLTRELVLRALAEAGVVKGIDDEAVDTACKLADLKGRTTQVLARGEPPLAAGGMAVKWLLPVKPGTGYPVSQGAALAELSEAKESREGFDVSGRVLSAEEGKALSWDKSILVKESGGGKKLFAGLGGELLFDGSSLSINSLKGIKGDVGEATGNIRFSGEVRITGKVQRGFSVIGGRDVTVGGSAEAALISSGGRALILQGVNGGGKGIIRGRTIETAFAERATLLAAEDVKVIKRCISCNIKTNGRLLLTGEKGMLSGGSCKARRGVQAAQLGAEERIRTEISFGQDYLIKDQIEAAERDLEKARAALAEIERTQASLGSPGSNGNPLPAPETKLAALRTEKLRCLKLIEQISLRIFTLREKFEEHHDSEIRINGAVYPGVVMESHDRYYEITEKRQGAVFYFNRETGRIMEGNA
ncbi:MAG: FapA family protein [Treponema sp.]|jgi:uncharacterized protein (DUF342 family)|nr:FapA family protein [Treponema sp.]